MWAKVCKFGSAWPVQGITSDLDLEVQLLPRRGTTTDSPLVPSRGLGTQPRAGCPAALL